MSDDRRTLTLHNAAFGHTQWVEADEARSLLRYEPDNGKFFWKIAPNGRVPVGAEAGCPDTHGYMKIQIRRRPYLAHRLAWLMTFGAWPSGQLDHINGDRGDNRIANLREATQSQNMQNTALRKDNKSGVRGVHWSARQQRWIACVKVGLVKHHLGTFVDKGDAAKAVADARARLFTHGRACSV